MKLEKLKRRLALLNDDADVVLFANGYKEVEVSISDDGIVLYGVGKVCPNVKAAIENAGADSRPEDECYPYCLDNNGPCTDTGN
jgi:hypothetical protein